MEKVFCDAGFLHSDAVTLRMLGNENLWKKFSVMQDSCTVMPLLCGCWGMKIMEKVFCDAGFLHSDAVTLRMLENENLWKKFSVMQDSCTVMPLLCGCWKIRNLMLN